MITTHGADANEIPKNCSTLPELELLPVTSALSSLTVGKKALRLRFKYVIDSARTKVKHLGTDQAATPQICNNASTSTLRMNRSASIMVNVANRPRRRSL